jgi:Uma2 family endonuclease
MANDEIKPPVSTRILSMEPDTYDQSQPRIGRRESEPHSCEITYLYDVLRTNFPQHHPLWDLHHYFPYEDEEIDVQFDISFFLNYSINYSLSSYHAREHENRVPSMAINILSRSTWKTDLSENMEYARMVKIHVYVVFAPFDVASRPYQPPFARSYLLQPDGNYRFKELRAVSAITDDAVAFPPSDQLDLDGLVPFNLGLVKLEKTHEKNKALFRLVLIDKDTSRILLSKIEMQERELKQEKQRAEQEKQRAEKYLQLLIKNGLDTHD